MNIEEIKVGERYNVCGCIGYKNEDEISITFECKPGVYCSIPFAKSHASMYFSLPPTPPKYDPCRKFKEGDKVRIMQYKGRDFDDYAKEERGKTLEVQRDEEEYCYISVCNSDGEEFSVDPAYLKLLTPVEELEQHHVETSAESFYVMDKKGEILARYCGLFHPHAREAAEAECARLNKEYRKKQNHDS